MAVVTAPGVNPAAHVGVNGFRARVEEEADGQAGEGPNTKKPRVGGGHPKPKHPQKDTRTKSS